MSDDDRYIPGVPCCVDTTQPDPEAAVAFCCDGGSGTPCPPGRASGTTSRGSAAANVAAVASEPQGAPTMAVWNT
jgi:hypothetical protein